MDWSLPMEPRVLILSRDAYRCGDSLRPCKRPGCSDSSRAAGALYRPSSVIIFNCATFCFKLFLNSFKNWLKQGLRHLRVFSETILLKPGWIDEFLESHEVDYNDDLERLVNSVMRGMN